MSIFNQEFGKGTPAADANGVVAAGGSFASLSFRRREFTEFTEGEYRILYTDGSQKLIKARSALEAMEQALQHGQVRKVQRSTIKRVKLIESENVRDLDPNLLATALIKPGDILVSFDTMTRVVHQNDAPAQEDIQPEAAPIAAAPVEEAAPAEAYAQPEAPAYEAPAAEEAPVAEAAEPAAETGFDPSQAQADGERALTPEEVEDLLHNRPAE